MKSLGHLKKLEQKKKVLLHIKTENFRTDILKQLNESSDPLIVLSPEQIETVKSRVKVNFIYISCHAQRNYLL